MDSKIEGWWRIILKLFNKGNSNYIVYFWEINVYFVINCLMTSIITILLGLLKFVSTINKCFLKSFLVFKSKCLGLFLQRAIVKKSYPMIWLRNFDKFEVSWAPASPRLQDGSFCFLILPRFVVLPARACARCWILLMGEDGRFYINFCIT